MVVLRTGLQLFAQPIIGVADNRDFWRLLELTGLAYRTDPETTAFKWVQLQFQYSPPGDVKFLTTELLFTRASLSISRWWFGPEVYDLRALGATHLFMYGVACSIFIAAFMRLPLRAFLAVAIVSVFVLSDGARVAYFNSLYSESASLVFLVGAVGCALLVARGRASWLLFLAYLAFVVAFAIAKPQDLAFVPGFAALAIYGCKRRAIGVVAAAALLSLAGWALASDAYAATKGVNSAVHIGEELLPHSPHPDQDRLELRLAERPPEDVSLGEIAGFYARHTRRWWKLAARASQECFTRLAFGNFEQSSGKARCTLDHRYAAWSDLLERLLPRNLWVLMALGIALSVAWARRLRNSDAERAIVGLMLLASAAAEFVVTITFEANGTAKHLFVFDAAIDLLLVLVVADLSAWLAARRPTKL
jgi:hypothetical protein